MNPTLSYMEALFEVTTHVTPNVRVHESNLPPRFQAKLRKLEHAIGLDQWRSRSVGWTAYLGPYWNERAGAKGETLPVPPFEFVAPAGRVVVELTPYGWRIVWPARFELETFSCFGCATLPDIKSEIVEVMTNADKAWDTPWRG